MKEHVRGARVMVALILALSIVPVASFAQTNVKPGFNLFSPEQDVQIGQQSAQQAESQLPIVSDTQVEAYVNDIGQRLARNAGGPQFQYRFRVVNSSDINAFALPGGFVYINRGVLEQAKNEGEVAGVIAHEISHVSLRHGTHQASKAYAAQAGLSILGGLLGGKVGSGTADIINAVGGFGLNALFLKYSRDLESQADIRGAQILTASGYSPADMIGFFQTLEKVDTSKKTNFLSDHPAPPDRISRIQQEAALLKVSATPTKNTQQLAQIQSRLSGTGTATTGQIARTAPPATSRRRTTGTASTQVAAPSTSLASYTSKSGIYRVSYPSNWQVFEEGNTGVTFTPQGGAVNVGGQTQIVYGAIVNHYAPMGNTGSYLQRGTSGASPTLESATNDLIGQLQQSSPYLKLISNSGQRLNTKDGPALAASLRGVNPQTNVNERVTVVTRPLGDGHLVYLLFVTPDSQAGNYKNALNSMVSSMQVAEGQGH
ncbi:MAG: M48 family metallopeptidase [Thermoanaerobaculia bacterium]